MSDMLIRFHLTMRVIIANSNISEERIPLHHFYQTAYRQHQRSNVNYNNTIFKYIHLCIIDRFGMLA